MCFPVHDDIAVRLVDVKLIRATQRADVQDQALVAVAPRRHRGGSVLAESKNTIENPNAGGTSMTACKTGAAIALIGVSVFSAVCLLGPQSATAAGKTYKVYLSNNF